MNWDIVEENWKQFKGKVRARWGNLTDDHLGMIACKRVALVGKLQEACGITKGEADKQIKRFALLMPGRLRNKGKMQQKAALDHWEDEGGSRAASDVATHR